jgi:hypothetical protein
LYISSQNVTYIFIVLFLSLFDIGMSYIAVEWLYVEPVHEMKCNNIGNAISPI